MTEKQIIDKLDSINLSLRQKKDLINVIKDITDSNSSDNNGFNDNDFIIFEYVGHIDNSMFDIYINNKLCKTYHYDYYGENEHNIIDTEIFNLFNTFKRVLLYVRLDDVFINKTIINFYYMSINSDENFILSFKNEFISDKDFIVHINKE